MTDLDLEAIEARAKAATPGPWHRDFWDLRTAECKSSDPRLPQRWGSASRGDQVFMRHAREDVPALVARVREETLRADHAESGMCEACDERDRERRRAEKAESRVAELERAMGGVHSVGTCLLCNYRGPGPRHECKPRGWTVDAVSNGPARRRLECDPIFEGEGDEDDD